MTQQLENRPEHDPELDTPVNARTMVTAPEDSDGPVYRTSRYTVYPTGYSRVGVARRRNWRIFVEDSGDGWAVRWRNQCLSYTSTWEFEPPVKGRTPQFLHRCRFSERSALLRAKHVIDRLVVDGMTYDQFVDRVHEEATVEARLFLDEHGDEARGTLQGPEGSLGAPLWDRLRNAFRYKDRLD